MGLIGVNMEKNISHSKYFNFKELENKHYQRWLDKKYYIATTDDKRPNFSVVMPPPNITGNLHIGHALDNTIVDIFVRYKRMQGYNTLWLPGTDHASIATELKIVEALNKEGLDKKKIGREEFLKRAWNWKEKYSNNIVEQMKKMGILPDWSRERFTMDEGLSKAVNHVFCDLYNKGLIYRGEKIINWCSSCRTTISDAEIEYSTQQSNLWQIRYPFLKMLNLKLIANLILVR